MEISICRRANELIAYGGQTGVDPGSQPWRIVFEVDPETVVFRGSNRNLVYCDQKSGGIVEAWFDPNTTFSYSLIESDPGQFSDSGLWSWANLTQIATPFNGGGGSPPNPAGAPFWFEWGMEDPGYLPYTQAVIFRTSTGDIYLLYGIRAASGSTAGNIAGNTAWYWRNLAQTPGYATAVGDPVGMYWQNSPSGKPEIHVFYRGTENGIQDVYELWAFTVDQPEWQINNLTQAYSSEQKPTGDPCALVWNDDPAGASGHVFYRGNDNKIYELYYDSSTFAWCQTNLTTATNDGATPTGNPRAFVWAASLHVGYRGSSGEVHELRRENNAWQPADDPSYDAGATSAAQRAGDAAICGLAWQRREAPQSIHWFYLTGQGSVGELYRFDGAPNSWRWNDLNQMATATAGSGPLPQVCAILQGGSWYFDPVNGSSMQLYLCNQSGAIYELRFVPTAPSSGDGAWWWTELTGWVTDAYGNPLPPALVANGQ